MISRWRTGQMVLSIFNGKVPLHRIGHFLNNRRGWLMLLVVVWFFITIGFLLPAHAEHSIVERKIIGLVSYCCLTMFISCLHLVNDTE